MSPEGEVQLATRTPDGEAFGRLSDSYRAELLAYCYRMLGSVHDAEDLVQETYLRAWRSLDSFEGRASMRTWLYRIATNVCLTALKRRTRRPLPSGFGGPAEDPEGPLAPPPESPWLEPFPEPAARQESADPASVVAARAGLRLALVAALQYLPPRQRAVLILRDVVALQATEVADLLGISVAAVKSILQRARTRLGEAAPAEEDTTEAAVARHRDLLDRFTVAFENADVAALVALLTEDVILEMPPTSSWFAGRAAVGQFFASRVLTEPGVFRMRPMTANGQPALAMYMRDSDGVHHAHAVVVVTTSERGIHRIVNFRDPRLFDLFGLPPAAAATGTAMA